MPLHYLLDEHLRGPLWRAVQRHNARGIDTIDALRVGDVVELPLESPDPEILLWAERENRILVSQDRRTLPVHLDRHLQAGHHSPGIVIIQKSTTIPEVLEFLAKTRDGHRISERTR